MPDLSATLPRSLAEKAKFVRLGPTEVPALLAHPDWQTPAPLVLWLHGRTVNKELDPGRYNRWLRAGLAVCAIDLPGHGERLDKRMHEPAASLEVMAAARAEIDGVIDAAIEGTMSGVVDADRLGIGGMSLGGMITLRRLCEPHRFRCAAVEGTTGNLAGLYFPPKGEGPSWPADHDPAEVELLDPMAHLDGFEPIPLLALHSEADEMVPWRTQAAFLDELRRHYAQRGASEDLVTVQTWPQTGAPAEHVGFGRVANEAKNLQTDFLAGNLGQG